VAQKQSQDRQEEDAVAGEAMKKVFSSDRLKSLLGSMQEDGKLDRSEDMKVTRVALGA
jgi:hypothetical protein